MQQRWGERVVRASFVTLFALAGALGIGAALASVPPAGSSADAGAKAGTGAGADLDAGSDARPDTRPDAAARLKDTVLSLARGGAQTAFQARFDKALALREWAVAAAAEARWAIFGQGYPGVLIGRDSWLFSTEEFEDDLGYLDEDFTVFAQNARDALKAKGIALLILPVPAKARIYARALPVGVAPAHEGRYAALLARFETLGLPAVDLATAYLSYAGGQDLFLRGDTHWSTEGAHLAARRVAAAIGELPQAQGFPATAYRLRESGAHEYRGDLRAFLPERGAPWRPLPPPDSLRDVELLPGEAESPINASALFGAQSIPVALVGTSYSAASRWHFEDFLKAELSCDVLNLSVEGAGPYKPLLDALGSTVLEDNGVRALVWELPERYVPDEVGS